MKRIAIMLLFSAIAIGCSTQKDLVLPDHSAPKPQRDAIAEMRRYAKVHKMFYRIYCTDDGFQAEMCQDDCYGPLYIEEGGRPRWAGIGKTQELAAEDLMDSPGSPLVIHAPGRIAIRERQCPPPIKGGPEGGQ